MPNRVFTRLPVNVNVLVYHNHLPVMCCDTKDISRDGVSLNAGPITYPNDAHIELEFEAPSGAAMKRFRLPVNLIYSSTFGSGLQFKRCESADYLVPHSILGQLCNQHLNTSVVTF